MNFEPTSNVVDVYVGYLRSKIQKNFGTSLIKTVRGHGYMLDISEVEAALANPNSPEQTPTI